MVDYHRHGWAKAHRKRLLTTKKTELASDTLRGTKWIGSSSVFGASSSSKCGGIRTEDVVIDLLDEKQHEKVVQFQKRVKGSGGKASVTYAQSRTHMQHTRPRITHELAILNFA